MKKYMYTRLIFSFLFIAFFATSCYTQLAVVKPHRVYVYERTVEPDEQEEPADTVYYEDEEEPASEVYVDVDNYYIFSGALTPNRAKAFLITILMVFTSQRRDLLSSMSSFTTTLLLPSSFPRW